MMMDEVHMLSQLIAHFRYIETRALEDEAEYAKYLFWNPFA